MDVSGNESDGGSEGTLQSSSSRSFERLSRDDSLTEIGGFSGQQSSTQSVVPIVTVSGSSPTPPSSPQTVSTRDEDPTPVIISSTSINPTTESSVGSGHGYIPVSTAPGTTTTLLTIPCSEERRSSISGGHGPTLVKQLSQPLLPSHATVLSLGSSSSLSNPAIQRQHSTPNPGQSRLFPSGIKPGDLFHIVPAESHRGREDESTGETFLVDSSSGIIQIISGGESSARFSRLHHSGSKEMEIFKTETKREGDSGDSSSRLLPSGSSMDDPSAGESGTSFSLSMEEDAPPPAGMPVQRSG